jgi:hypothetical protein
MIILLDLNNTLTVDADSMAKPFCDRIVRERYHSDLVEMLRAHHTILITGRPEKYREMTLYSIRAKTGWGPDEAFFNDLRLPPALLKRVKLIGEIMPMHGRDPRRYVAIESSPDCRKMYASYGIRTRKYGDADLRGTVGGG